MPSARDDRRARGDLREELAVAREEWLQETDANAQNQLRLEVERLEKELRQAEAEAMEEILPRAFAAVREAATRTIGLRHFDVQLIGGMVLHQGKIAEMKTGEGKTLVATLPLYLNALTGHGAHLVTPNDYLSKCGVQWMGPIYHLLGVSVGVIQSAAANPELGSFLFDPDYPAADDRYRNLRPVAPPRGLSGRHHLRHQQRVRLRLPARQHGAGPRRVRAARAVLRHRRRGGQHPHRRGAHAADHLRPGRGVVGLLHAPLPRSSAACAPERDYTVDEKDRIVTLTEDGIVRVER